MGASNVEHSERDSRLVLSPPLEFLIITHQVILYPIIMCVPFSLLSFALCCNRSCPECQQLPTGEGNDGTKGRLKGRSFLGGLAGIINGGDTIIANAVDSMVDGIDGDLGSQGAN